MRCKPNKSKGYILAKLKEGLANWERRRHVVTRSLIIRSSNFYQKAITIVCKQTNSSFLLQKHKHKHDKKIFMISWGGGDEAVRCG